MKTDQKLTIHYNKAAEVIKTAILQSQYKAVQKVNHEQLTLYFGIGRYISNNSRNGFWGTGALEYISEKLHKGLPGLRGFSVRNLRNMRLFYEEWSCLENNSVIAVTNPQPNDNQDITNSAVTTAELQVTEIQLLQRANLKGFPLNDFLNVPFTHHSTILSKIKDLEERYFYINLCAQEHLSVDALKSALAHDEFHHRSTMPNNFLQKLTPSELARRAVTVFKDEYTLDFINVEELGARDIEDVDERIVENKIVQNIKNFIMTFGRDFAFLGNQYRVEALGHTHIIDLLFFNRELSCLVAIELKTGTFKTAYLGQLNTYLTVLDDFIRKPYENPSIGIVLCKSADKTYVEYVVRNYDKPMGVATFKTSTDMPEQLRKALPDIEDLKKLL